MYYEILLMCVNDNMKCLEFLDFQMCRHWKIPAKNRKKAEVRIGAMDGTDSEMRRSKSISRLCCGQVSYDPIPLC